MTPARSESGIIRIVRASEGEEPSHVGMGILLTEDRFLTCAHVVNVALGRDIYDKSRPDDEIHVTVSFPILEDTLPVQARLIDWSPPGQAGLDCAVMELLEPAPRDVGISVLSVVPNEDVFEDTLSVYGSLGPGQPGAHITAVLQGYVGAQWSQLNVSGPSGIQQGVSGGSVWGRDQRACVGMVLALQDNTDGMVGYFLSAARIVERFGVHIPCEIRKIALRRQRSFTLVALILFVLTLVHFMSSRGSATNAWVPWVDDSKLLAAFFGVHCFAIILGPYVMWHAWRHARSFALRSWWKRVPAFSFDRRADMLNNTRLGASAVVLFLLLIPTVGQVSMLREAFFEDHRIFVNVARLEAQEGALSCNPNDPKWCTHSGVGTWSFLPQFPYFDHAYQYGEVCPSAGCGKMVTYFPALQPGILMGATALAICLFLAFFLALFKPWPYRADQCPPKAKE